jgi:hypothetical protein
MPPSRCASAATSPGVVKTKTASGSMNRRMSHAVAARLILIFRPVTQVMSKHIQGKENNHAVVFTPIV